MFLQQFENKSKMILIVYIDIILTGDNIVELERLKNLATEFEVKDLGQIRYFLRISVARWKKGISGSQRKCP